MAGNDKGKVFPLNRPRLIVGRTSVADISLNEPDISRWHFSIRWEPNEGCHIVQDSHAHGTVVNGRLLLSGGECRIKVGDEIKVGSTILRYEKL